MYKNLKCNNDKFTEGNSVFSRLFAVITGLVPVILVQQVTNLVNKLALLLKRSMLRQDSRDKPENDGCCGHWFSACCSAFNTPHSANELTLKAKDDYNSVLQGGRSMIEMLGVLAIIAVLSVGGIAGSSKAMEMYKINKYKSGMYELIGGFLQIKDELGYTKGGYTQGYAKIFKDLDMIPAGFSADDVYFKDNFGLSPRIYVDNRNGNSHWGFIYFFGVNKSSPKVCQAFVEIAVHFSADIWQLYRQPFAGEGISYYNTYGDHYCKRILNA